MPRIAEGTGAPGHVGKRYHRGHRSRAVEGNAVRQVAAAEAEPPQMRHAIDQHLQQGRR
jgi:hypothetical protein